MTVIVTDGTDKEYIEYESGCDLKNVFRGDEKATMSGGFERFSKGWIGPVDVKWHVGHYVLKGSFEIEDAGKTYLINPGDFVLIAKDSKVVFRTLEDVEAVFFCLPKYED